MGLDVMPVWISKSFGLLSSIILFYIEESLRLTRMPKIRFETVKLTFEVFEV